LKTARILILSCALGACQSKAGPEPQRLAWGDSRGAVVARVGVVELREEDLKRAMARDPGASPERFQSPAARRELVEGLVRFELLVQAAEKAGLTKDPDAVHALEQVAVTKLVNRELGAAGSPDGIAQGDVEREYTARLTRDFTLPEAVQVRHLRISDKKLAERLAEQARALVPDDDRGFMSLVRRYSEDATTREMGGDLGFIDRRSQLPPELVKAALSLRTPGETLGPVATPDGYEILRLLVRRAAAVSPLSSVEQQLRQRLYQERRAKALDDFVARLRTQTTVDIADTGR